jgi:hypothetical protein
MPMSVGSTSCHQFLSSGLSFVCTWTLYDAPHPHTPDAITLIISMPLLLCYFFVLFFSFRPHTCSTHSSTIYTRRHCLSRTMIWELYRKMNIFDESLFMTQVAWLLFFLFYGLLCNFEVKWEGGFWKWCQM